MNKTRWDGKQVAFAYLDEIVRSGSQENSSENGQNLEILDARHSNLPIEVAKTSGTNDEHGRLGIINDI